MIQISSNFQLISLNSLLNTKLFEYCDVLDSFYVIVKHWWNEPVTYEPFLYNNHAIVNLMEICVLFHHDHQNKGI